MESLYLIHSAKGTSWTKHKYIKKVGNKYIYAEDKISNEDLQTAVNDTLSGKNGTGAEMKKKLGSNYGIVAKTISSKFKKPSGKTNSSSSKTEKSEKESKSNSSKSSESSNSKSEKNESTKDSTQTSLTTKNENTTENIETKVDSTETTSETKSASLIPNLKDAITGSVNIGENDKYVVTQNIDGSTTVNIEFEDGSSQILELDENYKVVSVGEKIKPEDEKDDVKHCYRGTYITEYYGISYIRRF